MKLYHFCTEETLPVILRDGFSDSSIVLRLLNGPSNDRGVFFFDRQIVPVFVSPIDWRFITVFFPNHLIEPHKLSMYHCHKYGIFWPAWFIPASKVNQFIQETLDNSVGGCYATEAI